MATALVAALKPTLQVVKPWLSKEQIKAGDAWFAEIQDGLRETKFTILCLTSDNLTSNWIHFEAGAVALAMGKGKVLPFMLDVSPSDLVPPLGMFQGVRYDNRDGTDWLLHSLNEALPADSRLGGDVLKEFGGAFFDKLQTALKPLAEQLKSSGDKPPARPQQDILEEVLGHVRMLANRADGSKSAPTRNRAVQAAMLRQQIDHCRLSLQADSASLADAQQALELTADPSSGSATLEQRISYLQGRIAGTNANLNAYLQEYDRLRTLKKLEGNRDPHWNAGA
jgi:hypothetical protein